MAAVQAPGYFSVVQRAMDFTTLAERVSAGAYSTWDAFLADLELIFVNAMKYNTSGTIYHKHVRPSLGCDERGDLGLGLEERLEHGMVPCVHASLRMSASKCTALPLGAFGRA